MEAASPQRLELPNGIGLERVGAAQFERSFDYSTQAYLGLLSTFSSHIALGPDLLDKLLNAVGDLIDRQFDGQVTKILSTEAVIYRRK
ncbi:hypothetical protein QWI17_08545 [Gilvimarinus sp. SDUM040013]|uniref:Heme NO-binding domain-containing protein n=1 Tax=Gilvimarinus gilvus TaxID=3058038 RepID=A0ABU4S439_9GAMM|nr:hypothetical protein [Gilvimarinus sp. SDUM040013]MDO3385884.1 hypothetical protein [Gilvimarinus sp. SDUM040013]MDX6850613.1 hypothetical protein [Gilvimarinus sp. SDUM040013]